MSISINGLHLPRGRIEFVRKPRVKNLRITIRSDRAIVVTVPWLCSKEHAENFVRSKSDWIKKVFDKFDKIEQFRKTSPPAQIDLNKGQDQLFERLALLSRQHGLHYRKVAIRNQKTRWGSCSSQNNINLNIHLLTLPPHLQDYVMLHELVHIEHKNHSKTFWARLDGVLEGKAHQYNKELRNYRVGMIP